MGLAMGVLDAESLLSNAGEASRVVDEELHDLSLSQLFLCANGKHILL